ncbi:hypothetical protein QBC33DRAFT_601981 [Phialemonium atrogriseum]|uniref:Uncharacterized protein n=1 Tax=Phialemonium atrogriseum TaxID=1093897 RepID=A0AAJ0FHH4_9PEZI|nr:uncharacterized protein QBC33DRAFT_601981 [Phialemonium atrogriseum]KAK1762179.1 hypothetical protein QBC33DRAFT_601981 [Phialemonium atrogriseum]
MMEQFTLPFLPMLADDDIRKSTLAYPSNVRRWRPATEADCGLWFHTEVSNIILPARFDYPAVLQKIEAKPPSLVVQIPETVDIVYDLSHPNSGKYPLVIGEWKRNLIDPERVAGKGASRVCCRICYNAWCQRQYAIEYECPYMFCLFCFDGEQLLLLQFWATSLEDMNDCLVDCWVIPHRNNSPGCTLRYAFHRLLIQGFRRCQGLSGLTVSINGLTPALRELFSGTPVFRIESGKLVYSHPQNSDGCIFHRELEVTHGSFYWAFYGQPIVGDNGEVLRDTRPMWARVFVGVAKLSMFAMTGIEIQVP